MPQAFEIYNVDVRPRSSARTEEAYRLLHPEDGRVDGVLALLRDPSVLFASPHLVRCGDREEQDDCLYGQRHHSEELYAIQHLIFKLGCCYSKGDARPDQDRRRPRSALGSRRAPH